MPPDADADDGGGGGEDEDDADYNDSHLLRMMTLVLIWWLQFLNFFQRKN